MAAAAGTCHSATAARRGHVRRSTAHRTGRSGRGPRCAHLCLGMERRSTTGLTDSTRSSAWPGDWTADGTRFATSSLDRGLAGAAELPTLDTSLRPGNGLPHAGGDATALIYAQATTFIHA